MDLSDVALRERAQKECKQGSPSYWPVHTCPDCVQQSERYIALRDAARADAEILQRLYEGAREVENVLFGIADRPAGSPVTIARWLIRQRDAARAEQQLLIAQVNDIANDCEEVANGDLVGDAERRTWVSIAKRLRATAIRAQRDGG